MGEYLDFMDESSNGDVDMSSTPKVYCPECQKEFVHPRNLLQHRRVQHQGIRYYCSDCDHSYTRQYNLTHHRLKAHPNSIDEIEQRQWKRKFYVPNVATQLRNRAMAPPKDLVAARRELLAAAARRRHRKPLNVRRFNRDDHTFSTPKLEAHNGDVPLSMVPRTLPAILPRPNGALQTSRNGAIPVQPTATVLFAAGTPVQQITFTSRHTHPSPKVLVNNHQQEQRLSPLVRNTAPATARKSLAPRSTHAHKYCFLCPFRTEDSAILKRHIIRHTLGAHKRKQESLKKCKFCDFHGELNTLIQHSCVHFNWNAEQQRLHTEGMPIEKECPPTQNSACLYCDRKFPSSELARLHEKLHIGENTEDQV